MTISLLLSAGVIGLWVRGYTWFDSIQLGTSTRERSRDQFFMAISYRGRLGLNWTTFDHSTPNSTDPARPLLQRFSVKDVVHSSLGGVTSPYLGLGITTESDRYSATSLLEAPNGELRWLTSTHIVRKREIACPNLLFLLLLQIPVVLCLRAWRRERKRIRENCCPVCGYDLRATPDRCPECGTEKVMLTP